MQELKFASYFSSIKQVALGGVWLRPYSAFLFENPFLISQFALPFPSPPHIRAAAADSIANVIIYYLCDNLLPITYVIICYLCDYLLAIYYLWPVISLSCAHIFKKSIN